MQQRLLLHLCTLVVSLGFLVLVTTPAQAAPTNAKSAELVDLTCANGATYAIVANGNGAFTPGHILDAEGRNLIPVAFHFVGMNANGDVIFDESITKPGQMTGLSGDLIDCTFTATDTDPDTGEIITINGAVTLFVAPRH
jgi:hypothetical protein